MGRLTWLLAAIVLLGGLTMGGRYWIAQDKARCALVPDYMQAVLCRPEVFEFARLQGWLVPRSAGCPIYERDVG